MNGFRRWTCFRKVNTTYKTLKYLFVHYAYRPEIKRNMNWLPWLLKGTGKWGRGPSTSFLGFLKKIPFFHKLFSKTYETVKCQTMVPANIVNFNIYYIFLTFFDRWFCILMVVCNSDSQLLIYNRKKIKISFNLNVLWQVIILVHNEWIIYVFYFNLKKKFFLLHFN